MKRVKLAGLNIFFGLFAIAILFPIFVMVMSSFMPSWTMTPAYVNGQTTKLALIPMPITISQYREAFLLDTKLLNTFWNSFIWSVITALCQVVLALAAGYVLAKIHFPGSGFILTLFIFAMLMPIQVTIVPHYIITQQLHIYNNRWALYLPLIFAPFGSFLMCQTIAHLPEEMMEYARLEGAGTDRVLCQIVIPYAMPGLWLVFLFSFAEAWNTIEQPLILLRDPTQYPLSLLIHTQGQISAQYVFVAAIVMIVPIVSFLMFMRDRELGGLMNL